MFKHLIVFVLLSSFLFSQEWEYYPNSPITPLFSSLVSVDSTIFLCTEYGVFKQGTDRNSWEKTAEGYHEALRFVANDNYLFIGCETGLYRANHDGINWTHLTNGLPSDQIMDIKIDKNYIYVCIKNSVYKSDDDGENWNELKIFDWSQVYCLAAQDSLILVGLNSCEVFRSDDLGLSWTSIDSVFYNNFIGVQDIEIQDSVIYVAISYDKIYCSTDLGISWYEYFKESTIRLKKLQGKILFSVTGGTYLNYYSYHNDYSYYQGTYSNKRAFLDFSEDEYSFYGVKRDSLFRLSKCIIEMPDMEIFGDTTSCNNDTIKLSNELGCAQSMTWHLDHTEQISWYVDSTFENKSVSSIKLLFDQAGSHYVSMIKRNRYLDFLDSSSIYITVLDNPDKPTITMSNDTLYSSSDYGNQWYLEDTLISDAVGQWHYPQYTGNYTVQIGQDKCISDMSEVYFVEFVSVEETTTTDNISISPNPATDYIEINNVILRNEVTKNPFLSVKVFDVLGNVVLETIMSFPRKWVSSEQRSSSPGSSDKIPNQVGNDRQDIRIDVSMLPKSVYFVKIGTSMLMFIKI